MKKKAVIGIVVILVILSALIVSFSSAEETSSRGCRNWTRAYTVCMPLLFGK